MGINIMTINEKISSLLEKKNYKQKELSTHIGVSTSTLNNWLKLGRSIPSEYIIPICEFFGAEPSWLLSNNDKISFYKIVDKKENKSELETLLLNNFNEMNYEEKRKLLSMSFKLLEEEEEVKESNAYIYEKKNESDITFKA